MLCFTFGRITQAVMLRTDCKETKGKASRPGRAYHHSTGRNWWHLDQGGGGRGGNKWPGSIYILRAEPKWLADGNPLVLSYFWDSGYVVNSDLYFKVLLPSHPPTYSWHLSSQMSWFAKVSPVCPWSASVPHLVLLLATTHSPDGICNAAAYYCQYFIFVLCFMV